MAHPEKVKIRLQALGIHPGDLRETFSRSSGPGGQHVNKVSTAVTVSHLPSGLSVTASDSRSQSMNRTIALDRLLTTLEETRLKKRQAQRAAVAKSRRQRAKRSRATKAKMLEGKRRRGEKKQLRGKIRN